MNKDTLERLRETVLVPHGDPQLVLYTKLVVGLLWLVHLPLGFLYGAPLPVLSSAGRHDASGRRQPLSVPPQCQPGAGAGCSAGVSGRQRPAFPEGLCGVFHWFFLLIFSFSCTFALGLVDGTFINLLSFLWVMACLRGGLIPDPAALYGESFVRRFPFLYICILGVAYIIMFSIQRYWVDKAKRHLLLQQRIDAEKGKLSEMSLKVITAMYSALSSKIPEIDLHCQQTAELTQEMARRMGLDEAACRDGYYAGLLHEVGTVGLPDDVVLQRNITEEQYQLYKTYVERGCRIIQELQIVDRVAETVRYHRENYDGTGYLEGLQGEAIPLLSRILAVADFTDRHRRRGETDAQIAAALRECAGHAFDPACVGAMCKMLTEQSAARPQE